MPEHPANPGLLRFALSEPPAVSFLWRLPYSRPTQKAIVIMNVSLIFLRKTPGFHPEPRQCPLGLNRCALKELWHCCSSSGGSS
ncbi:hypothetical protein BaRGS_00027755, partial [Batillaria attramentaria]